VKEVPLTSCNCKSCGTQLESDAVGPCPNCGETERECGLELVAEVSVAATLDWAHFRSYYQRRPLQTAMSAFISLVCFVALFIPGPVSMGVGLLGIVLPWLIGPTVILRETITRRK
jgi:hypothetical protein